MLSARIALFVTSIGMAVWLFGCGVATDDKHDKTTAMPKKDRCSYDPEIERYVGFLRQEHARPVDYILGLFNDNDIVILGERWHPEMTQYELIFELVSDPRFSKKVGSIFTEIGTRSLNADLNDTLSDAGLTDSELERNLLSIYRNIGHYPYWIKTNYYEFLKKLALHNKTLPKERRVRIFFSDMPFKWSEMTSEKYKEYIESLPDRDRRMAELIIDKHRQEKKDNKNRKALVIMNYRHSFGPVSFCDGGKGDNVGRYLFEAFPGKVANVMLNTIAPLPDKGTGNPHAAIQNGKWDASFAVLNNLEVGFDLDSTPFGQDGFDLFPFREHNARYQDVYTGFVFYRPLHEHRLVLGIPGYLDDGFDEVLFQRMEIAGNKVGEEDRNGLISDLETIRESTYSEAEFVDWPKGTIELQISSWLENANCDKKSPQNGLTPSQM